jgi:hypothetical protein
MGSGGPPPIVVKRFESDSSPGTFHEIRISRNDGKCYCSCRGYVQHKHCKHFASLTLNDVLNALEESCRNGVLGI